MTSKVKGRVECRKFLHDTAPHYGLRYGFAPATSQQIACSLCALPSVISCLIAMKYLLAVCQRPGSWARTLDSLGRFVKTRRKRHFRMSEIVVYFSAASSRDFQTNH
jgi:hypothetical protein